MRLFALSRMVLIILLALPLLLVGCGKHIAADLPNGGIVYNKYNIHAFKNHRDIKASYANWVDVGLGQMIFPPNTKFQVEDWEGGFLLTKVDSGEKIFFAYHAERMGMDVTDYITLITSPSPVSLAGLSPLDRQGVDEGKALQGMSKDGVMTALGYPAVHATPSLSADRWTYWRNRFRTMFVDFDAAGKVESVQ